MYLILYPVTINKIIMRKIQFVLVLLLVINCKAQTEIIGLKDRRGGEIPQGAYLQDIDNDMDSFVGIYEYNNNGIVFRIHLLKKTMVHVDNYFTDTLIGEIEYYENNTQLVNTTSQLYTNFTNPYDHAIVNSEILNNSPNISFRCPECVLNEIVIDGSIFDTRLGGDLLLRRITVNGNPALKISIFTYASSKKIQLGEPQTLPIIPGGEYIMVKLP